MVHRQSAKFELQDNVLMYFRNDRTKVPYVAESDERQRVLLESHR